MSTISTAKFLKILSTFSESEIKTFENWLKSPWANSNKNLVRLLEKLIKYHPDFNHRLLTKERLFKQVLPNGKYSDRRMNNLLSEAYLSAERFLIFQNLSKDENLQKDLLTKELQNRHLEDWFFKTANQEIDRLDEKPIKDWEDHVALLQLHRRVYHHPNQNPRMQPGGRTIVEKGKQIDLVYLLEKGAIINEKLFRTRNIKTENYDVVEEIQQWHLLSGKYSFPTLDFYRMRFNYSEYNREKQYKKIRIAFFKNHEKLNRLDQKRQLLWLLNDAIRLIKIGELKYVELLPIYKIGLELGLLFNNGKITLNTFIQVVTTSNLSGSFSYTVDFIDSHFQNLKPEIKNDAKNWALAHINYYQKNYDKSLSILINHEFKNSFLQHISKLLTVQNYFDLFLKDESYELYLMNYFDSFEKWLTRDKIRGKAIQKAYVRFVQICRVLAKSWNKSKIQRVKIVNQIRKERNVMAHEWIEARLDLIMRKK